ncbi:MAG: hypothetical protein WBF73_26920 [Bradyrhizobium sp.]|jgi:hypothetical protein
MPMKDGFAPDHPLPVFLSDGEEPEQPGIWRAWDTALISSQTLKTSILGVTAAAIVFALLLVGNPLVLFANAPALLADLSAPKPGTDASTPTIQPTAGTQALPPMASEAPTGDETATAFKTAYQNQAEIRQPLAESLLNQFQAWAAEEDARAQAAPTQPVQDAQSQPVQDAEPQPVADAEPQVRPMRKHRQVRRVQNARAEIQAEQNLLAKLRRKPNAQGQVRPVQDARTQDRPVQDAQAPSLWQSLGLRN